VRIRGNLSEGAARTGAIAKDASTKSIPISGRCDQSHAGDIVLLPIAVIAFWTLAYDLVLVARWPAHTITWCFLAFAITGAVALGRLWTKTSAIPGKGYRFHPSHLLLLFLGLGYATTALFVRRPNQDDVVYFHRALTQLLDLHQPIFLRQTSVDMDAAAFSPVHLTTSYEMLMAFLGHYLGINPLYSYQVVGHVCATFLVPFVFYWCAQIFGLDRWPAAIGALLGMAFLFLADESPYGALLGAGLPLIAGQSLESINTAGMLGFGTVSGYLWQGKPIIWILFLPTGLALSYRFLLKGNQSDIVWLTFLGIAGVGLSNTGIYLIPAVIGCSWLAFFAIERLQRTQRLDLWHEFRRGLYLAIPMAYPIAILGLLTLNVIPKPIDTRMFGPSYMPWRPAVDFVIGGPAEYLRCVVLMVAVPLLLVRGRCGLFLFLYLCGVWLLCLNPLLAAWWMKNIFAYTYFRLVYLLPLPFLCALTAAAGPRLMQTSNVKERAITGAVLAVIIVSFVFTYRGVSILPRDPKLGVAWKSPAECQLLPANIDFAKAAGRYIAHAKLLAPIWTAGCELPLLFPEMKVVAPRLVTHYFANAGKPEEGNLRNQAAAFIVGERLGSPDRVKGLELKFRKVVETGRANAIAVPESQSQRVLATLKSIDPGWHGVLEAGGLVLMLRPCREGLTAR
jgi:hypothetical protein